MIYRWIYLMLCAFTTNWLLTSYFCVGLQNVASFKHTVSPSLKCFPFLLLTLTRARAVSAGKKMEQGLLMTDPNDSLFCWCGFSVTPHLSAVKGHIWRSFAMLSSFFYTNQTNISILQLILFFSNKVAITSRWLCWKPFAPFSHFSHVMIKQVFYHVLLFFSLSVLFFQFVLCLLYRYKSSSSGRRPQARTEGTRRGHRSVAQPSRPESDHYSGHMDGTCASTTLLNWNECVISVTTELILVSLISAHSSSELWLCKVES